MSTGCVIVLVPDEQYHTTTPDAHCTIAYFGEMAELEPFQKDIIMGIASDIAELKRYYETPPKVAGRGVFMVDPKFSDGNTMCYVDLIDHNVLPAMRKLVEERAGFVNRGHGFQPHMTIAFGTSWMPDLAKPSGMYAFKWKSVDVWAGDDRTSFPIGGSADGYPVDILNESE